MKTLAIDLTSLNDNQESLSMIIPSLIIELATLYPACKFYLLISNKKNIDIHSLKINRSTLTNIKIININYLKYFAWMINGFEYSVTRVFRVVNGIQCLISSQKINLDIKVRNKCIALRNNIKTAFLNLILDYKIKADLLFCPLGITECSSKKMPIITLIDDLAFDQYPYLPDLNANQHNHLFDKTCARSTLIIATSDYAKNHLLSKGKVTADQIKSISLNSTLGLQKNNLEICHPREGGNDIHSQSNRLKHMLERYQLTENKFLIYPANFTHHKNHAMLITAYGIYRKKYPHSELKIVFIGKRNVYQQFLIQAAKTMGLHHWIHFHHNQRFEDYPVLLKVSLGVICPSLHEGAALTLLQAIATGKPIICSHIDSLTDKKQFYTWLCDPRKPETIVNALYHFEFDRTNLTPTSQKVPQQTLAPKLAKTLWDIFINEKNKL